MSAHAPPIHRRDFLNGAALALAGLDAGAAPEAGYPPARTGLQGHTDALAAPAHRLRQRDHTWREDAAERDEGMQDLVVVGAGISGLTGAWLFQRHAGAPVRILILDALDDIGGHARRNEFTARNGVLRVGHGGSQSLESPSQFSPAVKQVLADVGVQYQRFESEFFDQGWAARQGLQRSALFFGQREWGEDRIVLREPKEEAAQWLARTPLSASAQADWLRLLDKRFNPLPGLTRAARRSLLSRLTYNRYLEHHAHIGPEVRSALWQDSLGYFGAGADAVSALDAFAGGLVGFAGLDLGTDVDPRMSASGRLNLVSEDKYIYHFPDGNHGVARALLRALLPTALPGSSMHSLADARLDYAALDLSTSATRIRLGATLVGLRHQGPPAQAESVKLRYVDARGQLREVQAKQVLLACWHRVIARLTDELPAQQVQALDMQVKTPLVYANVLLSNWQAWRHAGIHRLKPVGGFWHQAALDFPVSMGGIRFPQSPTEPMLLHLAKVVMPGNGQSPRAQAQAGRAMLAQWPFARFEAETAALLQGALGGHGFDAARDIEALTVNRWSHGYSDEYLRPWDAFWPAAALPCERARRGWGRVAIANADAGAYAYAHSAIDQAVRAVGELLPHMRWPAYSRFPGPPMPAVKPDKP